MSIHSEAIYFSRFLAVLAFSLLTTYSGWGGKGGIYLWEGGGGWGGSDYLQDGGGGRLLIAQSVHSMD